MPGQALRHGTLEHEQLDFIQIRSEVFYIGRVMIRIDKRCGAESERIGAFIGFGQMFTKVVWGQFTASFFDELVKSRI